MLEAPSLLNERMGMAAIDIRQRIQEYGAGNRVSIRNPVQATVQMTGSIENRNFPARPYTHSIDEREAFGQKAFNHFSTILNVVRVLYGTKPSSSDLEICSTSTLLHSHIYCTVRQLRTSVRFKSRYKSYRVLYKTKPSSSSDI